MAISRAAPAAVTGGTILASSWEAEFNNIINNALALVSPWTGNMDAGNFRLIDLNLGTVGDPAVRFEADANTGIYSSGADTVDIATGGVRAASFGASALIAAAPEDARTNTVDVAGILRSTTSGVPAANIGVGLQFDAESADENPSTFGRIDFVATDVTAASEDTVMDVLLRTAGAAEAARYRFQATGAFLATITHAATAARTYTLPDATGSFLLSTLAGQTITSPIFATGVGADGSGFKHGRATRGAGTDASVTVTWGTAFADTSYTAIVSHTYTGTRPNAPLVTTKAAGSLTVFSPGGDGTTGGTIEAIGVHD